MHAYELRSNHWRAIVAAVVLLTMAAFASPAAADPGVTMSGNGDGAANPGIADPMSQVKNGVSDVIDVFKAPDTPLQVRREKLRQLGVKYFDFESMTRSVMGYHWRELSPAQQVEVVSLFTNFINDAYLSKLQEYSVKKVEDELPTVNIQFTRETFDGSDYAEVYSTITLKEQKDPIDLNYMMHLTDGQWKV